MRTHAVSTGIHADPHGIRTPGRQHAVLQMFVGTWVVSGDDVTGEQKYEVMPGEFFIRGRWHRRFRTGKHIGTSILGFDLDKGYFLHTYDNLGYDREYYLTVRDRVWTVAGHYERATMVFSADGRELHETWEILQPVGWRPLCDLQCKRVGDRAAIARDAYAAYPLHDRARLERCIAQDFTFTSPYDDAIDRATYFERCWPNHATTKSLEVERVVLDDGNAAIVDYNLTTVDGRHLHNVERLTFEDDRIASIEVFFGTERDRAGVLQRNS